MNGRVKGMDMENDKFGIMNKTAEKIKYFRKLQGLSQEKLALLAGLNPAFMGHIERAQKCPTVDTLNKIACALNISLSELLNFDSQPVTVENAEAIQKVAFLMRTLPPKDAEEIVDIVSRIIKFKQES
jgi:transcriptional regulator with XRE-family HTH domain